MRGFIVILITVLSSFSIHGNTTERFYQYYISGDMDSWQTDLNQLKLKYKNNQSAELLQEIVKAQYGLIAYFIGIEEKRKAAQELELAHKNIDKLIVIKPNSKNLLAYKGAFYGFGMGVAPWKLMYYGPKSQEFIEKSLEYAASSPESNFEYANMRFWAPAIVGGDKVESLIYYRKTIAILEQKKQTRDWYYLWSLTAYSQAVKEVKGMDAAKLIYKKIAKVAPEYNWLKKELNKFPEFNL